MGKIELIDLEDVERRLAFVMSELHDLERSTYAIVHTAKAASDENHMARWCEGRFSAFIQQARDAVWTARCTVGLVPDAEQGKDEGEQ